jgi:sigma-E factor negative regulatory protein RseC
MKKEEMMLKAENLCGGKIGDNVEITIETVDFMKATVIMYGIPFAMFMIGIFAGYFGSLKLGMGSNELIGFVLGFVLVVITYLLIKTQEKRWQKENFVPKAIRVIK